MKRAAFVALIASAVIAVACRGGDARPSATEAARFQELRTSVSTQLDGIGVNIGQVPDDVLNKLLNHCHELERYADQTRVKNLCDAIQRAHDNSDPALVDQIVQQFAQLTPK